MEVAKKELGWEVDYERERECTKQFRELLAPYPQFYIPEVVGEILHLSISFFLMSLYFENVELN